MYDYLLFDLDGTLTDSKEGITKSVAYSLQKFGISVANLDDLIPFVGPPLAESFRRFYDFEPQEAQRAVDYYREYFSRQGMYENAVYPRIPEMLQAAQAAGKELYVATSKPTFFAEKILAHFKLSGFFRKIAGSHLDGTRVVKGEVIEAVLAEFLPESRGKSVMIGDRCYDITGAKQSGIDSIGVLYGFGGQDELEEAGADYIIASVDELQNLLLK